jgi:hypothetical protein
MHGNIGPLIEILKGILENLFNRDPIQMDEKNVRQQGLKKVPNTFLI